MATLSRTPVEQWPDVLTPGEVASLFGVDPKTVTRWAAAGRLASIRTEGGHRRYRKEDVKAMYDANYEEAHT